MNRERLIELRDFLVNHPQRFYYGAWVRNLDNRSDPKYQYLSKDKDKPEGCGTVGCVAGWAVALFGDGIEPNDEGYIDYQCEGGRLLGLNWHNTGQLFLNQVGPDNQFYGVEEAIRRINQLLDTGSITPV